MNLEWSNVQYEDRLALRQLAITTEVTIRTTDRRLVNSSKVCSNENLLSIFVACHEALVVETATNVLA